MTSEIIKHQGSEKLCKEILDLSKLKVTPHAIREFYAASNCSLNYTGAQIKSRLSEAKQINPHERPEMHLKIYKGTPRIYFQDHSDPDLIYAVKTKEKNRNVLLSVIKRLKT
jgi:hypothetical protein